MTYVIAPIVEGHGDVGAVPALLRRLLADTVGVMIARPIRAGRSGLIDEPKLRRFLSIAEAGIRENGGRGCMLLVLDANGDCAATLGPDSTALARRLAPDRAVHAVIAVREFESWIVGGAREFEGADSDAIGAPKAKLKSQFGKYSETADQARLIARADLELLGSRSRSFRKFVKVVADIREDHRATRE